MHLSVIDKAASRAPERQILRARTNGDNALDGRTRSAFWAAGRPTRSSRCGFGHHDLLTGLGRQFGKLAFGSIEGTARFDERDHGSAATG